MPARKPNSVNEYVRKTHPGLDLDKFETFHRIVSKLRSRAKARGFDPGNLTQEQFDIINNDNLPELEKGEKVHLAWENSSMAKGMLTDGVRYLTEPDDYYNKLITNSVDGDILDYLYVPSTVKMAARGLKWGNNFLLAASHFSPQQIDLVKDKLQQKATNYIDIREAEDIICQLRY